MLSTCKLTNPEAMLHQALSWPRSTYPVMSLRGRGQSPRHSLVPHTLQELLKLIRSSAPASLLALSNCDEGSCSHPHFHFRVTPSAAPVHLQEAWHGPCSQWLSDNHSPPCTCLQICWLGHTSKALGISQCLLTGRYWQNSQPS